MRYVVGYIVIVFCFALLAILSTGCATKHIMKECKQLNAEGYEDLSICKKQYRVWN